MDILLSTINSRYHHTAFGLRYIYANLGSDLQPRAEIVEFVLGKEPRDIVESLLSRQPRIIGLGVYIWNTQSLLAVVSLLKKVAPEVIVVLGGPEISYETESQALYALADHVIQGESDFQFRELCEALLSGAVPAKLWPAKLPLISEIALPYRYYSDEDIAHRVIYVEASRGCPYKCEYCLSSLDLSVRNFDSDDFLSEMQILLDRGARSFKFVDRTFNLSPTISRRILEFFAERISLGLFLHFEMVPDRLPLELRDLIRRFPAGSLQFEIGIQTWNPVVAALVSRRQDYSKIGENFRFLREETGVHTHADLIVGLPGEDRESFARGFDSLAALSADEIQVGILKRLKGTPIVRHDREFEMIYSSQPPFQILKTRDISFAEMQGLGRFAQFWDLYANSGNFQGLMHFFRNELVHRPDYSGSMFSLFWDFSSYLTERHGQAHAISRGALQASAEQFLSKSGISALEAESIVRQSERIPAPTTAPRAASRQHKHLAKPNSTSIH